MTAAACMSMMPLPAISPKTPPSSAWLGVVDGIAVSFGQIQRLWSVIPLDADDGDAVTTRRTDPPVSAGRSYTFAIASHASKLGPASVAPGLGSAAPSA
jgi:hypothetical protein